MDQFPLAALPTRVPEQLREMLRLAKERQQDRLNAMADDPMLSGEWEDVIIVLQRAADELERRHALRFSGR